ncbi:hypothetical protein [Marinobacterium stanieri]|uniref:Uncharacterized protein n=1 Tax=Marinobacterium stanieri TaxID=49186 RepID=A0A1N6XI39_9GAMM|nr:hypothetical protein [Marinobacterium stanieri]SIR01919.1 hypothetical protein SAMN05421647_11436 [Marinobacterium stanieri]
MSGNFSHKPAMTTLCILTGLTGSLAVLCSSSLHASSDSLAGTWAGSYKCGQGLTAATLKVVGFNGLSGNAEFSFGNLPGKHNAAQGSYTLKISKTSELSYQLTPIAWLERPNGYSMVGFRVQMNGPGTELSGTVDTPQCTEINLSSVASGNTFSGSSTAQPNQKHSVFSSASSNKAVLLTATNEAEGVWLASVPSTDGPFQRKVPLELTLTEMGGKLETHGAMNTCAWVISPTTPKGAQSFDAFAYRGKCRDGSVKLGLSEGRLLLKGDIENLPNTISFNRSIGAEKVTPANTSPIKVLGVGLGDSINNLLQLSDAPLKLYSASNESQSTAPRFALPVMPLEGTVQVVAWPAENYPEAHEDVLAAYTGTSDRDSIIAMQRSFRPAPGKAPLVDTYTRAILDSLGEPSSEQLKGRSQTLTWHFDSDGLLMPDTMLNRCKPKTLPGIEPFGASIEAHYNWFDNRSAQGLLSDQKITQNLFPSIMCYQSISYSISSNDDGTIRRMTVQTFDHQSLAAHVWEKQKSYASKVIRRELEQAKHARSAKPRL